MMPASSQKQARQITTPMAGRPLGLYIHWPFCLAKCPYCDFNSHVASSVDTDQFGDALCDEMTHMAALLPKPKPLTSVFFGGGTPSLMPPDLVARLIEHAKRLFGFASSVEITAEANPTSVEADAMLAFRRSGVNRVSMGVQALDDTVLRFLGREHSASQALAALETVKSAFENMSVDLIYATPGQSTSHWRSTLDTALGLGLSHLSLYQLTIEEGTVFFTRQRRGEIMTADDDHAAYLYEITQDITAMAGLPAYEVSNHAMLGAECAHNLIYWQGGDWLGIGPGAHGRFTIYDQKTAAFARISSQTRRSPAGWRDAIAKYGHAIETKTKESAIDWASEMLMMGLRLHQGVNLAAIESLCGRRHTWLDQANLDRAIGEGWLRYDAGAEQLSATAAGMVRLNSVLSLILR